jgi:hypothetical protein
MAPCSTHQTSWSWRKKLFWKHFCGKKWSCWKCYFNAIRMSTLSPVTLVQQFVVCLMLMKELKTHGFHPNENTLWTFRLSKYDTGLELIEMTFDKKLSERNDWSLGLKRACRLHFQENRVLLDPNCRHMNGNVRLGSTDWCKLCPNVRTCCGYSNRFSKSRTIVI